MRVTDKPIVVTDSKNGEEHEVSPVPSAVYLKEKEDGGFKLMMEFETTPKKKEDPF